MFETPYNNLTNTIGVGDVRPAGDGNCGNTVFNVPKGKKPAVKKDAEKLTDVTAPRPLIVYTDKK